MFFLINGQQEKNLEQKVDKKFLAKEWLWG